MTVRLPYLALADGRPQQPLPGCHARLCTPRFGVPPSVAGRGCSEPDHASAPPEEGIGHALRTPLTALHGALGLLGAGLAGDLPPDARALVAIALRNCHVLEGVVESHLGGLPPAGVGASCGSLNPDPAFG